MPRIGLLPEWILPNITPAFEDLESATAVEMVNKLYASMREMQADYNKFAKEINTCITEFKDSINKDHEAFKNEINQIIHDYIITIDTKIAHQDRYIEETIVYIKNNLSVAITELTEQMKESGEFDEAIQNAFNELGERVTNLESEKTLLSNRVTNLENTNYSLVYNAENEEFTLVKGGNE